jgi:hypothetical protein
MTKLDFAEIHISKRAHFAVPAPTMISEDDARQGHTGYRVLYVLGFGLAGTIFADTLVFIYFVLFYTSG